jgi:hypothetical protein
MNFTTHWYNDFQLEIIITDKKMVKNSHEVEKNIFDTFLGFSNLSGYMSPENPSETSDGVANFTSFVIIII